MAFLFRRTPLTGVSDRLVELVRSGDIWTTLVSGMNPTSRTVDLDTQNVQTNCYGEKFVYDAELLPAIPTGKHVIVLFLYQMEPKMRILDSALYKNLEELNTEINKRMSKNPADAQLTICWNDYTFTIKGATGNIYIEWARELSVHVEGELEIDKMHGDIGFIVHTNGHYKPLAVYPLLDMKKEVLFIHPASYRVTHPTTRMRIRANDTPPSPPPVTPLVTLSDEQVRINREMRVLPDHEQIDYKRYKNLRKLSNGTSVGTDDELTSGTSIDTEEFPRDHEDHPHPGVGEDMDADVLAFFSGPVEGEQAKTLSSLKVDILNMSLNPNNKGVESSADDEYSEPLSSRQRETRVPRALVPRLDHRTAVSRIRFSPRTFDETKKK